jgi:cytoskeletal protein CcmA (bactofilin family)
MFGRRKPFETASRNDSSTPAGWKADQPAADSRGPTLVPAKAATDADGKLPKTTPENVKGPDMSTQTSPKPPSGYVPEIPRRAAVDNLAGSPSRRPTPRSNIESKRLLVGKDISLSGEITACDILVVEGTVQATLEQSQLLEVTDTGTFRGKVQIEEAVIAGTFEGTLTARDKLTVKSTGRIIGTVRFGQLEVELGGVIKGDTGPLDEPIAAVQDSQARELKETMAE